MNRLNAATPAFYINTQEFNSANNISIRSNTSIAPQRVRSSIRVGGNSVITEADGALRHIWCGVPLSMRSA